MISLSLSCPVLSPKEDGLTVSPCWCRLINPGGFVCFLPLMISTRFTNWWWEQLTVCLVPRSIRFMTRSWSRTNNTSIHRCQVVCTVLTLTTAVVKGEVWEEQSPQSIQTTWLSVALLYLSFVTNPHSLSLHPSVYVHIMFRRHTLTQRDIYIWFLTPSQPWKSYQGVFNRERERERKKIEIHKR